ncbi:hypothetical protein A3F55_02595 [Candidatus Adlerbacteria bacterium RIFCSPHIGHO2_12_FULL_53_18]|uniref:Uncharacterized protein n=1 Tax=Candidatus Adlerbacteria bacterium RIFCSPHIGHO2_12_FULL_53_18 TaxID=1797242 RepID=A0A1F4XSR9_9BACT|nr:MAG: hypothetical protein A3F55_02595 [Candidatus Adlerbacteria bacterium RIFCSPHIGHO2_12_FULL_53_18]
MKKDDKKLDKPFLDKYPQNVRRFGRKRVPKQMTDLTKSPDQQRQGPHPKGVIGEGDAGWDLEEHDPKPVLRTW